MPENHQNPSNGSPFSQKLWKAGAIFAFIVIFILLFKALFSLLLLTLAAVLIAIYFHGIAGDFQKYFHWSPRLSIILSVVFNIILLVALNWFIGARIQQQLTKLSDTLPSTVQQAKQQISRNPLGQKLLKKFQSSGGSQKTMKFVKKFFSSGFGIFSDLYIVIIMGLFFTASPSLYKKGIVRLLPSRARDKGNAFLNTLGEVLKKWLKGQLLSILFVGVLTAIGLVIIGIPLVLTLAIIAGLFSFIPNFGPIIALIPAVLIALTKGPQTVLIVAILYVIIQIIQAVVEKPLVQKKMINMPPALIIFGQVAMGLLSGFWGVLLAAPIVAIVKTTVKELYLKKT